MANNRPDDFTKSIIGYVDEGLKREVAKIAEQHKEAILKDVEQAMSDVVARLSTRIAKYYSIKDMTHHIVIQVQKDFTTNKHSGAE